MKKALITKIFSGMLTFALLLSCSVIPTFALDSNGTDIIEAAKAYVTEQQNNVTPAGLLAAVKEINADVTMDAEKDFFIKHAVPGVKDDDTKSGYPLNIPGSDGAVAAVFTLNNEKIGFTAAFAHETETIHIGSYAIAGVDEGFTYETDANDIQYVTNYTGNADKLIFPSDKAITPAKKENQISGAFDNIKAVYIDTTVVWNPDRYTRLQKEAFSGWKNLTAVQFGVHAHDGLINDWNNYDNGLIPDIFANCPNLKYVKLLDETNVDGSWLFTIPTGMFKNCSLLENVNIPNNKSSEAPIAFDAFSGTAVRDIICPPNTVVNNYFQKPNFSGGTGNVLNNSDDMTFCRAAALAAAKANEGAGLDEIKAAVNGAHNAEALLAQIEIIDNGTELTFTLDGVTFPIAVNYAGGVFAAAKAYVTEQQNNVTPEGLLEAVQKVNASVKMDAEKDFFIKHAVPGVKDDDTKSGYPLNIPGSDGAVAAVFTLNNEKIGFTAAFAHETETIHIGSYAIAGVDEGFTYETDANDIQYVTDYSGTADKIIFPDNKLVTMAEKSKQTTPGAFDNVKAVYIATPTPENWGWDANKWVKLQNAAFSSWKNLTAVQFNTPHDGMLFDHIKYGSTNGIIPDIFKGCPNLKYVRLPEETNAGDWLYAIPSGLFTNCSLLENVNMPRNKQACFGIAADAFAGTAVRDIFCQENASVNREWFSKPNFSSGVGNVYNYKDDMTFCRAAALAAAKANEGAKKDDILNAIDGSHNAETLRTSIKVGSNNGFTLSYDGIIFTLDRKGDINLDGEVNSTDIIILRKHLLGISVDAELEKCDVNNNGVTDIIDLIRLKKIVA